MYSAGKIVKGKITNITHFGFFIETDQGWKGLIHISEVSEKYVYNIEDYFDKGQDVEVLILSVDEEKKQLSCSYKQANNIALEQKTFNSKEDFDKLQNNLQVHIKDTLDKIEKD